MFNLKIAGYVVAETIVGTMIGNALSNKKQLTLDEMRFYSNDNKPSKSYWTSTKSYRIEYGCMYCTQLKQNDIINIYNIMINKKLPAIDIRHPQGGFPVYFRDIERIMKGDKDTVRKEELDRQKRMFSCK